MIKRLTDDLPVLRARVIDGDTIEAWIIISHEVAVQYRIRLRGLEGGELGTPEGARSKLLLEQMLKSSADCVVFFRGHLANRDNHGRLVGDFIIANGASLCQSLLNTGAYRRRTAYAEPESTQQQ